MVGFHVPAQEPEVPLPPLEYQSERRPPPREYPIHHTVLSQPWRHQGHIFQQKYKNVQRGKLFFPPTPQYVGEFGQCCLIPETESDHPNAIQGGSLTVESFRGEGIRASAR